MIRHVSVTRRQSSESSDSINPPSHHQHAASSTPKVASGTIEIPIANEAVRNSMFQGATPRQSIVLTVEPPSLIVRSLSSICGSPAGSIGIPGRRPGDPVPVRGRVQILPLSLPFVSRSSRIDAGFPDCPALTPSPIPAARLGCAGRRKQVGATDGCMIRLPHGELLGRTLCCVREPRPSRESARCRPNCARDCFKP